MFEDSLVESGGRLKTKRGWTTWVAFAGQIFILGILILIPLIYTEALPKGQLTTFLVAPPPPPPPPPPPAAVVVRHIATEINDGQLRQPTKIPQKVLKVIEDENPPAVGGVIGGVPGGVPGGSAGGVIGGIIGQAAVNVPKAAVSRVRVSAGVVAGNLVTRVEPVYPQIAKNNRISGSVILHAVISKQGTIENLQVVSGHPMLTQSALDAVRRWRYRPYLLNGEPVEVDTTITVNFTLG
jgi:periplasmic protein TonB